MMYLLPLAILAVMVFGPILFIIWTIRRIHDLCSQVTIQSNEIELLNNKTLRLQSALRKLEEKTGQLASHEVAAATERSVPRPEKTRVSPEKTSDSTTAGLSDAAPLITLSSQPVDKLPETVPVFAAGAAENAESVIKEHKPAVKLNTAADNTRKSAEPSYSRDEKDYPDEPVRPRSSASAGEDWTSGDMESLIGGNLMSKIGALLLVIGLALFLKYSLGSMGALAKLSAGGILGGLLLAWGVIQNKRNSSDVLSVGLIGGGWACLYLTAFAAHGVEATRIVDSPLIGMLLMLAVAAGMVVHSLSFASEIATGLAFLLAFASLFVSEVSLFSEVAAILLTISMLVLSYRYSWNQLAVAGLVLTYGSMLARLHWRVVPSGSTPMQKLIFVQSLLVVNWASFELIGMNYLRRFLGIDEGPTRFLFPLNMGAYLTVSFLAWPMDKGISLSGLAGIVVIQYLISGALRGFWCKTPGEAAVEKQIVLLGSLEDCLAIVAASLCLWLWYVLPAPVVVIGWALVGLLAVEIAFRAPWQLLRLTGHAIMTLSFGRLFMANMAADGMTMGISHRILTVVPMIFLMTHLYFRTENEIAWESAPTGGTRAFAPVYSYFAAGLAAFLLRFEIGAGLTAPAWAIAAIFMIGFAGMFKNRHFGRQAVLLVIGAVGYGFSTDLRNSGASMLTSSPWFIGTVMIMAMYICRWMAVNEPVEANASVITVLDSCRKQIFSMSGSLTLAFLIYLEISGGYLTLAWAAMGIGLLMAGFFVRDRALRLTGLVSAIVCIIKVFLYDARVLDAPLRILAFVCLGGALILISWAYTRFKDRFQELL